MLETKQTPIFGVGSKVAQIQYDTDELPTFKPVSQFSKYIKEYMKPG